MSMLSCIFTVFLAALFAPIAPIKWRYLLVLVPWFNGILIYVKTADQPHSTLVVFTAHIQNTSSQIMDAVHKSPKKQDAKLT